jgi:hypothetical protein
MTHIDEGTIHAWLDGALPPDEGARLQAHVADCPACSAAVAEARGLIAASSRILSALDDVPGGVIPRAEAQARVAPGERGGARTSEDASGADDRKARVGGRRDVRGTGGAAGEAPVVTRDGLPRRRPWYLRPQFAAAAGIAFVAISATLVVRGTGSRSVADFQGAAFDAPPTAAAKASTGAATEAATEATTKAPAADAAASPAGAAPMAVPMKALQADAPAADSAGSRRAGASAVATPSAPGASRPVPPARDSAARPRTLTADLITSAERARVRGEVTLQQKREAAPPPAAAGGGQPGRSPELKSVAVTPSAAAAPAAPPQPSPSPAGRSPQPGVAEEGRRTANTLAAPSAAATALAGCYRLAASEALRLAGGGERWQLELVPAASEGGVATYLARDLSASDAARDERVAPAPSPGGWRWAPLPGGEVVLLRGTGASAARFALTPQPEGDAADRAARARRADDAGPTLATRIACPPR